MLPLSVHLTAPVLHGVVQAVKDFVAMFAKIDVIEMVTGIADIVPKIVSMLMKVTLSLKWCSLCHV